MRYPGYEVETVANPWVFADLYQPQRMRGPVSPVVFQTGAPGYGDPYLDAALRAMQGDMGEVGARLPQSDTSMGNYDMLGTAADTMQVLPTGMRLEADVVPRGISASLAPRAQAQMAQRLAASPLLQPVQVAWGSGAHAGKIHVVAVTRSVNLTAWEILSELRTAAERASADIGVTNGLTVPTVAYNANSGSFAPTPGVIGPIVGGAPAPAVKGGSSAQSGGKTGQTVIDALLLDPPAPVVSAQAPRSAVPGWALGVGAVVVTGGLLYALRRGGGRP